MTKSDIFEKYGCVQVDEFLDEATVATVSQYFENRLKRSEWKPNSDDPTSRYAYYADPLTEVILKQCLPAVEAACGKQLLPTYSYARIYQPGEQLEPHIDRPACEVSVTVSVAYQGTPSPIWMQYSDYAPQECKLPVGSAVVYKGCEATHWRHPLENGQLVVQFMLHYVDKNGPYANFVFDRRSSLSFPPTERRRD